MAGGGGDRTVTNSGLWTICVFRVMTFKRQGMTLKNSDYLLIMNVAVRVRAGEFVTG